MCFCDELLYPFSAGVGRTGTFITLDAMMERLKERDDLNIFEFVNAMRTRRMCMVQTLVRSDVYLFPNTYVRSRIAQGIFFTLLFTFVLRIWTVTAVMC